RLSAEQQFEDIVVRTSLPTSPPEKNGSSAASQSTSPIPGGTVYLRDLVIDSPLGKDGKPEHKGVELGAKNYDVNSYLDGQPSTTLAVFQLPGSNALDTAHAIRTKMEELKSRFPEGVEYRIHYDTTVFIEESINSVIHTLFEAFILVFIVVLVFLQ